MAPGRKQARKSDNIPEEENVLHPYEFQELGQKHLSGLDEDIVEEETQIIDKHGKKRSVSVTNPEVEEDHMGGEVQTMLKRFGGQRKDFFNLLKNMVILCNVVKPRFLSLCNLPNHAISDISKALLAKRKRLETYTKASLKTSNQKIETVWKTQQEQRQTLSNEYSQQFLSLFQQWEVDVQKTEEQEDKITNLFRQQQKLFQQARIVQSQRLKSIKQLYEQFSKNMCDLEKNHENLFTGAQNELKKEMALLQKKILMDTQQQEMASVRKSLQSMLF